MAHESSTQKITNFRKAERLAEIKNKFKTGVNPDISEEEMVEAYENASNIKPVGVTFRTSTCSVTVGKLSGVSSGDLSPEDREFLRRSSNSTRLEMFPEAKRKLDALMTKIHKRHRDFSIGGSDLMEFGTFEGEFLPFIKAQQEELEKIKEEISENFDLRLPEFEKEVLGVTRKLFPASEPEVSRQLDFIRRRGRSGYLACIEICLRTKFGEAGTEISREDLRDFLRGCKEAETARKAQDIVCSIVDDIWNALLSYLVNISSEKYKDTDSLEGFGKIRSKLKDRALRIRREVAPLGAIGAEDLVSLTSVLETLSLNIDKYDAIDEGFAGMVQVYVTSRKNYGYEPSFGELTETRAKVPEWLKMEDIIATGEDILRNSSEEPGE